MLDRTRGLLNAGKRINVVAYGDSICETGRTEGYFGGASCAENNWVRRLVARLRDALPDGRFEAAHFAVGGQNTYEGLGRFDYLAPYAPDLVLIEFGSNDCGWHHISPRATGAAMQRLIECIRVEHESDVVVVCPGGDNPLQSTFDHLEETFAEIVDVAQRAGVMVVEIRPSILAATDGGKHWDAFHNGPGDCHPNDAGHEVWAQTVADALLGVLGGS